VRDLSAASDHVIRLGARESRDRKCPSPAAQQTHAE